MDINQAEVDFPVFAGKILFRKLFKGKVDKDEMLQADIRHIIETKDLTYDQKRLLVQMKQIIESDHIYQNSRAPQS